jgi:adenine-specific DNA-methyltransferase
MGNVSKEGGVKFENGKKPIRLIKQLIYFAAKENATVLDFFAGSGTTGHAVLDLNQNEGFNLKFILSTYNEENSKTKIMDEVCYPRIKNVFSGKSNLDKVGDDLRFFETDFVDKDKVSDDTRSELVQRATEMICVKEDTFSKKYDNKKFKIYENDNKVTGILYDLDAIEEFKSKLNALDKNCSVYVFSLTNETFASDFSDLIVMHKLTPIPESILEVYRKLFG